MADYSQGFGFQENSDLAGQRESFARRQKLLDALQTQAMSSPIQGAYGLEQALLKLATAYVGSQNQEKMQQQSLGLEKARRADLGGALDNYTRLSNGAPGDVLSAQQAQALMENDQNPQLREPVQANPRAAVLQAMTSQHPEMQNIAKMDAALLAAQEKAKLAQKPFEDKVVNNQVVRVMRDGTVQNLGNYGEQWGGAETIQGPSGNVLVQRNKTSGKIDAIDKTPRVNVNSNVDMSQKGGVAASEALGKKVPDVLESSRQIVMDSQQAIQDSQRLLALASDPRVITGFGAGARAGLANLATTLGFQGPDGVAQTQAMLSAMANQTLNQVKRLPGAITEKERPFLEQAAAGQLQYTPETIQYLANLQQQVAHNSLLEAMSQYRGAAGVPGAEQGREMYPMPNVSYQLDPNLFPDIGRGRVRYSGKMPGVTPAAPASPEPTQQRRIQSINW